MAKIDFVKELKALGYLVQEPDAQRVFFEYEVPVGKNVGKKLMLGFEIGDNYPMDCPSGPHFQSLGVAGWSEPPNNIHASPFGSDWRYWSRPFALHWNTSDKKAKTYLAHIKNLLTTL
ncbi:MAG: hypothetical protein K2Q21_13755 [Chitinophagaceae bacterium]|nr:hypothetical protein [Chitinophagaceae bacterium]